MALAKNHGIDLILFVLSELGNGARGWADNGILIVAFSEKPLRKVTGQVFQESNRIVLIWGVARDSRTADVDVGPSVLLIWEDYRERIADGVFGWIG